MTWQTQGILTNPAIDAILADSGALAGGQSSVRVIIGGNVAMVVAIEHRNAANTANINSQTIASGVSAPYECELPGVNFALNERIRLRLVAAVVGSVQGSVFTF